MISRLPVAYLVGGGLVAGLLAYVALFGARGLGGAAVTVVDGAIQGGVEALGSVVGVPVTNQAQCEKDRAAGRTWDASFSCPAKDFLKHVFS